MKVKEKLLFGNNRLMKKANSPKKGPLRLIIGKEIDELIEHVLKEWAFPYTEMDTEGFLAQNFIKEAETFSLFSSKKGIFVRHVDVLKKGDLATLCQYAQNPNPQVSVLFSASFLPASSELFKLVEKHGEVTVVPDLKPWEKEKELQFWLVEKASLLQVKLSQQVAASLIALIGSNQQLLLRELEKLASLAPENGEISYEMVLQLCQRLPQETFWQLSDAVFKNDRKKALVIASSLMDEENVFFALIGHLRTQYRQARQVCSLFPKGGQIAVAQTFPQWKGKMVQKKIDEAIGKGDAALSSGLIYLFETEARAKNGSRDLQILLECLLIQMTKSSRAASSSSKFT